MAVLHSVGVQDWNDSKNECSQEELKLFIFHKTFNDPFNAKGTGDLGWMDSCGDDYLGLIFQTKSQI